MNEIIQKIMDSVNKKGVQSDCKKILKKCSFKSSTDLGNVTELVVWLYIYDYYDEAIEVCDTIKDIPFTGNYTLWNNIDGALCVKARILRERGDVEQWQEIIDYLNQYRSPHLYKNLVDWFQNTLEINIQSNLNCNSKARAKSWRLIKLESAIRYREAGNFPVSDEELEEVITSLKELLSQEK